jgi:alkylresorcinol/alkylpyrone synthase
MARVMAVGTAVPPYEVEQAEMRDFAKELFASSFANMDRLLPIFDHTLIQTRRFSRPRDWFETERSFAERNQVYIEVACQLGEEAIRKCLQQARVAADEIDHIFFVSTTGISTPSIDAYLVNRLGMNRYIKRTPIWGLGCAGGVAGLARAAEYVKAFPDSKVLLLAVELCGLTFRRNDLSKSNLVATSLFADGAAAVLLVGEQVELPIPIDGPAVVAARSAIWPESLDVMGWDLQDDGLKVIFSRDIPSMVQQQVKPMVDDFLQSVDVEASEIDAYISHPGGAKVLQAYQEALGLKKDVLQHAFAVLRQFGNMSSVTVLFVLEKELQESHEERSYGLMTALGPGFSLELLLLRWGADIDLATHGIQAERALQPMEGGRS